MNLEFNKLNDFKLSELKANVIKFISLGLK